MSSDDQSLSVLQAQADALSGLAGSYQLTFTGTNLTGVSSAGDAKAGFARFHENCQVCHGPNASGAYLPDLKKSQMIVSADNFKSVVIDGARKANGMVSFAKTLSVKDAEDIRAYIISEAKKAQAAQ